MIVPEIISGNKHSDDRGSLIYNNSFNAALVKRIYFIENRNISFVRGWQGHKIEQRWFSAVSGEFEISLIKIDNWQTPSKLLPQLKFLLDDQQFSVLHIPGGYITSIKALSDCSKLMVMSDYLLNEIEDEYRFEIDYFK